MAIDNKNSDGWPNHFTIIKPLEVLERAAHFVGDILLHRHIEPSETPVWGAGAYLDAHLEPIDGEPTLPFEA